MAKASSAAALLEQIDAHCSNFPDVSISACPIPPLTPKMVARFFAGTPLAHSVVSDPRFDVVYSGGRSGIDQVESLSRSGSICAMETGCRDMGELLDIAIGYTLGARRPQKGPTRIMDFYTQVDRLASNGSAPDK